MRILLAQLAPRRGDVEANVARLERVVTTAPADLAVFPELFLSGYRVGDRIHRIALHAGDPTSARLAEIAHRARTTIVVGAPVARPGRRGETTNAVVVVGPEGALGIQEKRYLPTYGPFEEGSVFAPGGVSRPVRVDGAPVGFQVCYDAFFPEVSRELALAGADLLVVISAAPVTSGRLFDRVLPARAVENACPLVYVNRVGVEDGVVFGGGSAAWDARGEIQSLADLPVPDPEGPEERMATVDLDLAEAGRWRPFRPVLRDIVARPGAERHAPAGGLPPGGEHPSGRTDGL